MPIFDKACIYVYKSELNLGRFEFGWPQKNYARTSLRTRNVSYFKDEDSQPRTAAANDIKKTQNEQT